MLNLKQEAGIRIRCPCTSLLPGVIAEGIHQRSRYQQPHVPIAEQVTIEVPPIDLQLRLGTPGWAKSWQVTPSPEQLDLRKGYLYLGAEWPQQNSQFQLSCPMQPRVAKPYPLTMQPVAYVTRRPIVYCVENADHPWEERHFKVKHEISQGSMQ